MSEIPGEKKRSWIGSHFEGAGETIASLTVIVILVPLGLLGIFGSKLITDNILSVLCTVLSLATIYIYQLWRTQRRIRKETSEITQSVNDLVRIRSPYTVTAPRISGELAESLQQAKEWSFRGGSGRWQRECVLPQLSQEKNRTVPYRMLILDPTELELCRQYAEYRNKHRVDDSESTATSVRNELLACIVACAWYTKMTRVSGEIYLSQTYSPLRQDISPRLAAITVSDKLQSGLFLPSSSWYYESLIDEYNQHCSRSPKVVFDEAVTLPADWRCFTANEVKLVLAGARVQMLDGSFRKVCDSSMMPLELLEEISQSVFRGRKV